MHSGGARTERRALNTDAILPSTARQDTTALRQSRHVQVTHAHPHLHWTFSPPILIPIGAYAWFCIRRFLQVRRTSGPRAAGPRQLAAFAGVLVLLVVPPAAPPSRLGEAYRSWA